MHLKWIKNENNGFEDSNKKKRRISSLFQINIQNITFEMKIGNILFEVKFISSFCQNEIIIGDSSALFK